MKITKRNITAEEADILIGAVKQTPNITGYSYDEWLNFKDVLIAELDGKLAGVCVMKKRAKRWSEIAVLIVLPDYRGKGFGTALAKNAYEELTRNGENIFASSRNPKIINLLKEEGFIFLPLWRLPREILISYLPYLFNPYRFVEFLRKRSAFPSQPSFTYAIKRFDEK